MKYSHSTRKLLTLGLVCSLVYSGSLCKAQSPGENLGLGQAVQLALEHNPSLRETQEKINQAETAIPLARSALYPNLSIVGGGAVNKDADNSGAPRFNGDPYNQYTTSLKLNQTLFQIGSFSAVSSVQKDRDISKLNAKISSRDLTNSVIQAYYQIVLFSRNVRTLQQQQKIVKESLSVAQRRERTGRGQLLDVLQVRTQVSLLDAQISTAQNQLEVAVANLSNLLGNSTHPQIKLKDHLEAPDLTEIDQGLDLKHYEIPEIERDVLSLEKIDDLKQVTLGQNLPTVSLVGAYNFTSYKQSDLYDASAVSWTLGLQLTIPLFSGFSGIYQEHSLESQRIQLEYDKKSVENQVLFQQITNRKNLETALDSIETGIEALKLATASSKEAVRNYSQATIDFLQLLTVEQAYVQAEQSLNTYKYNYIAALGNYFAASGQDMSKLVEVLEKANQ